MADYEKFAELKLFRDATNFYPPAGVRGALLPLIIKAIQDEQLEQPEIKTAFMEWIAHGFKSDNLSWLREWAPAVKRGEKPWERKSNGNGHKPVEREYIASNERSRRRTRGRGRGAASPASSAHRR